MPITFPITLTGRQRPQNVQTTFELNVPTDNPPAPTPWGFLPTAVGLYHTFDLTYQPSFCTIRVQGPFYDIVGDHFDPLLFPPHIPIYSDPYMFITVTLLDGTNVARVKVPQSDYNPNGSIFGSTELVQRCGFTIDVNRPGRTIIKAFDDAAARVTDPNDPSFGNLIDYSCLLSFNGSHAFHAYAGGLATADDQILQGQVSNGTVSMRGATVIDGQRYGGTPYSWAQDIKYPAPADPSFEIVTGEYSGSLNGGPSLTLTDNLFIVGFDQGFSPPEPIYSTASGGIFYGQVASECELKGKFFSFADVYPDKQGVIYTGRGPGAGGTPGTLGTTYELKGVGEQSIQFTQSQVQAVGAPGFVQIEQTDYLHASSDGPVFAANGDAPNYELPVGRAFFWPAGTLTRQKSTTIKPDTWTGTRGVQIVEGDGLVSFRVSSLDDVVTGALNKLFFHLAWRYENLTVESVPDNEGDPAGQIRIRLNQKGWTFTASGDTHQIDTCEPDGVYDYQDGQDSLWPLFQITHNGVKTFVPSQERDHCGCNYLTQILFDHAQPGYIYTIKEIAPFAVEPMEVECLVGQAPKREFTRATSGLGTASTFGQRGFRVQCDGRLALEFPWQVYVGSLDNPPQDVPIPSSSFVDGVQPTQNLFDYINSIDGFTFTLANDQSHFFNQVRSLNGWVDDLFAGGTAWNGSDYVDGTSLTADTSVDLFYGCRFDDLDSGVAQGDITSGAGYGDGSKPILYHYAGHFRDRVWGVAFDKHQPLAGQDINCFDKATGEFGGMATTRKDGWFESGLPYLKAGREYLLDEINSTVDTWGRRSDRPSYIIDVALESGRIGFWLGITYGTPIVRRWWHTEAPGDEFSEWLIDDTVTDARALNLAFRPWDQRLIATYSSKKQSAAFVQGSYDFGTSWFPILTMSNLTEYVPAVNPRTQETVYAYRNSLGFVVVDIYGGDDTFIGTYPSGGIALTDGGTPLPADSAPAITVPRDGDPSLQLAFVSGGVPLRFGSTENGRSWYAIPMGT